VVCLSLPQRAASCPVGAGINKRPEPEAGQYRRLKMRGAAVHISQILLYCGTAKFNVAFVTKSD
jgi:hypothetical protein